MGDVLSHDYDPKCRAKMIMSLPSTLPSLLIALGSLMGSNLPWLFDSEYEGCVSSLVE